jgi:hypothetical protein
MRAGRLLRWRGFPPSVLNGQPSESRSAPNDGHLVWVWLDWPVACAPFPGRMRPRRGREKIYAAVFRIGVPRSDKSRQLVPSMLSLTQGAFEEISDAVQVGLLGWPRLYRRRMCFPFYRSSVYPAEGQKSDRGQVRRRGWQLLGLTVSESHLAAPSDRRSLDDNAILWPGRFLAMRSKSDQNLAMNARKGSIRCDS